MTPDRMNLTMKPIRFTLFLLSALLTFSCDRPDVSPLIQELDEALEKKGTYQSYFNDRVDVLKAVLSDQKDPEQVYNINSRIAMAYKPHSFDSTMRYLQRNRRLAAEMLDKVRLVETDLAIVEAYVMAGYHAEADDMIRTYDEKDIPQSLRYRWCEVCHVFYGEMQAYTSSTSFQEKLAKRDHYRNVLLGMTEPDTYEWFDLKREEAEMAGNMEQAREYAMNMMNCRQENSNDYARAAFFYANTFMDSDSGQKEEWLIRSAMADVMCATRDYASLNTLSRLLFNKGDIDRAFRYAADHCMRDALSFNGKLRPWQISQFFPQIERAYQQKHARQTRIMVMMIAVAVVLLIVLLLLLLFIFKRQQILDSMRQKLQESYIQIEDRNHELVAINSRLVALNAQMKEADKVKQEYIALFLGIVSESISKTRQYKNHVLKAIRQGKTQALVEEIELLPSLDEDILEFYKMFDQTFINLYPDFVDRFNELLADGAAIVPKGDDILTPELRIFALIKLGITDSSKIASLLHYSANTIYNYRAKTKNKARGSREDFENAVRNIE